MQAADLQVCTSAFENLSLAILEGMACGTPVLGTPGGGTPELVGQIDPALVLADDQPHTLAEALPVWLSDRERLAALGRRARALAVERYDWERVVDGLEAVCSEVVALHGADAGAGRGGRLRLLGSERHPQPVQPAWLRAVLRVRRRPRASAADRRSATRPSRSTTRVDDIFDDPSIDAVYLSTPVSTHYQLVKRALESGKHVLVEKPLATTVDQAEALADLAAARRADAHGRPHVRVQPAGPQSQRADRGRPDRSDLLHRDDAGESGPVPEGRQRAVGSRPARRLDPELLARRGARSRSARAGARSTARRSRTSRF